MDGSRLALHAAAIPTESWVESSDREVGEIMRELRCRDAGFDCDAVMQGESDEQIFAQAAPHAQQAHGIQEVTSEMKQQLSGLIHDA